MKNKSIIITLILVGIVSFLVGCLTIRSQNSFCSAIPADSYSVLCQIGEKVGTSPEVLAGALKITNLALLNQAYTAQAAYDFLTMAEEAAENAMHGIMTTSYYDLILWLVEKKAELPAKVQAALVIMDEFIEVDSPEISAMVLSPYDWQGILKHLKKQKMIVAPFLP